MTSINIFLLALVLYTPSSFGDELQGLTERVQELERRQQEAFEEFHNSQSFVRPFLHSGIHLGGYFETGLTHINGPDTSAQYTANSHLLGINLSADFSNHDRFVMQLQSGLGYSLANPHNDPAGTPSQREYGNVSVITALTQGFFERRFTRLFNVQVGLGYAAFGNAFQQREIVLFKRRGGPNILRGAATNSVGLAFPLWMGAHVYGSAPLNTNQMGYNFYTFSPTTKPSSVGVGTRLWYRHQDSLTFGVSHQIGEMAASQTYQSYSADMDLQLDRWGMTLEYARSSVSHGGLGPESYYLTPYYNLIRNRVVVYATADYLDNPNRLTGTTPDPYKVWSTGAGINYLPLSNVRIRFGYLNHNYVGTDSVVNGQERDLHSFDLSLGLAF